MQSDAVNHVTGVGKGCTGRFRSGKRAVTQTELRQRRNRSSTVSQWRKYCVPTVDAAGAVFSHTIASLCVSTPHYARHLR